MSGLVDKYLVILKTTKEILLHPFAFGETLEDSLSETKRAARYLFEGVIFAIAIFQIATKGFEAKIAFLDMPFASEIIAGVLVLSTLVSGLTTHPFAKLFSDTSTTWHGSFSSFLYWVGFSMFVLPTMLVVLSLGWTHILGSVDIAGTTKTWILFAIMGPVLIIYYFGTIISWIAAQYKLALMMAALAIIFGYTLSSVVVSPIAMLISGFV